MNTYTVIASVLPAEGHHMETVPTADATGSTIRLQERLGLELREFEVVAAAWAKPFSHSLTKNRRHPRSKRAL